MTSSRTPLTAHSFLLGSQEVLSYSPRFIRRM